MRATVLALALMGCAAQNQSYGPSDAYKARVVAQYGPRCAQSFKEWSYEWQDCVTGFAKQEQQQVNIQRAAAAAAILQSSRAVYIPPLTLPAPNPSFNCTTVNYGGIVQTRCQ